MGDGVPVAAVGIIPACAGNTAALEPAVAETRDHPRVCGEHTCFSAETAAYAGSSPRVRGTQEGSHGGFTWRGIIPACAGNTSRPNAEPESWRDHPRVCGEHDTRGIRRLHNSGSSPRVRGTRCAPSKPVHLTGIIPACAGNTLPGAGRVQPHRDHPRVCGEHPWRGLSRFLVLGSSPRVRGTPLFKHCA